MRLVIDTNVFVSGVINPNGPPGRIVDAVYLRSVTMLYEYNKVLHRTELPFNAETAEALLTFVESYGEYVSGMRLAVTLPDATDLPFLEVAIAGRANALVTGNAKHFKPLQGRHNVHVISPPISSEVLHGKLNPPPLPVRRAAAAHARGY